MWLYRIWPQVIDAMILVKPATVIQWHRKGVRLHWRCLAQGAGRDLQLLSDDWGTQMLFVGHGYRVIAHDGAARRQSTSALPCRAMTGGGGITEIRGSTPCKGSCLNSAEESLALFRKGFDNAQQL